MTTKPALVRILVKDLGTGEYMWTWVPRADALAMHQPGLIPPPGRPATKN